MNTRVVEWLGLKRPSGVHPPGHKALALGKAIEHISLPERVVLPLQQHIGSPAQPVVKRGDEGQGGTEDCAGRSRLLFGAGSRNGLRRSEAAAHGW